MLNPYGAPISLENAKKAAAVAAARKNNWAMAVAVTGIASNFVYFEKIDGTQTASGNIAIAKSHSAAVFKRPTKAFQYALSGGNTSILATKDAILSEGGIPIIIDGKIVGAIGRPGVQAGRMV